MLLAQEGRGDLRFVFYNVENLFDPFDDSLTLDDEFLPWGDRGWTWEKFLEKENRICKVLTSVGLWEPPELIGLCEIENRFVLNWLTRKTPLMKYNYRIIHRDSPDERGIDVALLYLPSRFRPLNWSCVPVRGIMEPGRDGIDRERLQDPTRDVLYVRGLVMERDTLHLLICHWPSRWEGYLESLPRRLEAARVVREILDSLWTVYDSPNILVAGDLNDELSDPSLSSVLRVQFPGYELEDTVLYYTGDQMQNRKWHEGFPGTCKYRGRWYEFDHIFVNGSFMSDTSLFVKPGGKRIFSPDFLLEEDPGMPGVRPFRTHDGFRYHGGFSDHLPVYIDIWRGD